MFCAQEKMSGTSLSDSSDDDSNAVEQNYPRTARERRTNFFADVIDALKSGKVDAARQRLLQLIGAWDREDPRFTVSSCIRIGFARFTFTQACQLVGLTPTGFKQF